MNRKSIKKFTLTLAAQSVLASFAYAHQPVETIKVWGRLDETLSLKQAQHGIAMVTVDREQIEEAGTTDLNGILQQFVPGLTVIPKNGRYDYATYSLQGSRSKDILWLIDGIRINNRLFGGGYLDSISTAMIERIEVLKAGQGVMYGTDAVAGVVNIITRSYKGSDEGQIGLGVDSLGSTQMSGYASSLINDIEVTVFGASDQSDGTSPWKSQDYHWTATDRERGYDVQNIGLKLAWDLSDTSITFMGQYNQADLDYARSYFNVNTQNKREQTLFTLSLDSQLTSDMQAMVKAYYHDWDTDYFRLYQKEDGSFDLVNNNSYWGFQDIGVKGWLESQFNQHQWSLGLEHQQYEGSDEVMGFKTDTEKVTDVFGQFKPHFSSLPGLNSAFGLRYSTIHDGEETLIGEASAKYTINQQWQVSLSGGNSFRLPTAEQLYAKEDTYGNRDLEAEEGKNVNAGVIYNRHNFSIETNLFWRKVDNLIGVEVKDGRKRYVNVDSVVETQGIGAHANLSINDNVSSQLAAGYTDIRDKNDNETLLNIPDITANWRVAYDSNDMSYGLWSNITYIGTMTAYDIDYGDYTLVDIGGYYQFGPQQQHKLRLKVENLFDKEAETGISMPGNDAPSDHKSPVVNIGVERNLQATYTYSF